MKILHIDETFHPAFGYQCNPLAKFQKAQGHDVTILTVEKNHLYPVYKLFGEKGDNIISQDKYYIESTGVNIIRVKAKGYIMRRLNYVKKELFNTINNINPDVIMCHCVETLTAMRVLKKLKNKYPIVFDSHMLSMASTSKIVKIYEFFYRLFITSSIIKHQIPVIKTQDDDYINSHLSIPKNLTPFISFGTDTQLFCVDKNKKFEFLKEHNLPLDSFVIVSTGKLSEGKGGLLFANVVSQSFNTNKNVVFVVVANLQGQYEQNVKSILDKSPNKVIYYPVQNYLNLPYFYQISDACVFPKQCSMSFYDAQSCGALVIAENNNVNAARLSHNNGVTFNPGSVEDFKKQLEFLINLDDKTYNEMSNNAINFITKNYDYKDIAQQYTDILTTQYLKFKNK